MDYELRSGREAVRFDLPVAAEVVTIEAAARPSATGFLSQLRDALDHSTCGPALKNIIRTGDKVAIVTSDITRLAYRTDVYLQAVVAAIVSAGAKTEDITIVMATGTHRAQTPAEHLLIVGPEVFGRVEIVDHDCRAGDLVDVGRTQRGTVVAVNKQVHDADKVILTGGISYHLLAGFGGGRKSLAAGVCGYETIRQNHSLALQADGKHSACPRVGTGVIAGNPAAEDMAEMARMIGADFLVNVIPGQDSQLAGLVTGDPEEAFARGCQMAAEIFGVPVAHKVDWAIVSCGGYPQDIQLYQAVKALDNASHVVRKGGAIILVAECSDGVGSDDFESWLRHRDLASMQAALRDDFSMGGFIAARVARIIEDGPVVLVSALSKRLVTEMKMLAADSMAEAFMQAQRVTGSPKTVALMPNGTVTHPIVGTCSSPSLRRP